MFTNVFRSSLKKSHILFAVGFCLTIISGWMPLIPHIRTFMFTWKVELAASIFIALTAGILLFQKNSFDFRFSSVEKYLIIYPLILFIVWSGLSGFRAVSWKSALDHTAIWILYLIFYICVRELINYRENFKLILLLLTVLLLIIGIPSIIEYCSFLYLNNATSLGIRFSKYAEIVNLISPLLIAATLRAKDRKFKAGIFCITVMWLFIISSLSRTGFILFTAGTGFIIFTVFALSHFKRYRRKAIVLTIVLILTPIPIHLISLLSPKPDIPVASRFVSSADSNNSRKMLNAVSLEMIQTNPILGLGANNYGRQLNNYRTAYAKENPDDVNLSTSEAEIPERAHNEYLQIVSELGITGGIIFVCFLASILVMIVNLINSRHHISLFPIAAVTGVMLFLLSAGLSSYSFRLIQNGFVFFFVLAVASKLILSKKTDTEKLGIHFSFLLKPALVLVILSCLFLGTHSFLRALSGYYSESLLTLSDAGQAQDLYEKGIYYDDENAVSYLGYGLFLINNKQYAEAIQPLKKAVKLGESTSADYSLLATAQLLSGDAIAAADTFREATILYPRSSFVRTRYADLLQKAGNPEKSRRQLEIAMQQDLKAAKTWWNLMQEGVAKTNLKTLKEKDYIVVFDLTPQNSYTTFMIERLIYHPEETPKIDLSANISKN